MFLDAASLATGIVKPGGALAALLLTIGNTGKTISAPTVNITKATVDNPAEDGVTYECSFVSSGTFTVPS